MKAKELLKEIVKAYPDVVAIAQDENKNVNLFKHFIPTKSKTLWDNHGGLYMMVALPIGRIIEWDSENWKENIVTINDL